MKNNLLKKAAPYLAALLIFLSITVVYFSPLFEGQRLKQHDISMFKGMSKEIVDFRAKTGEEPLWTNSMFGGMPAWQISVQYKDNLFRFVDKVLRLGLPQDAGYVFLYFLGFFMWEDLCKILINFQFFCHPARRLPVVPREHKHPDAHIFKGFYCFP